jgi:hypothetical protein
MTHRTQLSQPEEAPRQVTLVDLELTVACPTCHTTAGKRCVTRAGKPAREQHGRRYEALEQAAGITEHRNAARREAEARGGWLVTYDRKAENALLQTYAARIQPKAEPAVPTGAEPKPSATPAQRQLGHALTAPAATSTTSALRERFIRRLRAAHLAPLTTTYLDDLTYATARAHAGPGVQAHTDQVQEQLLRALPDPLPGETCTAYADRITTNPNAVRDEHDQSVDHLVETAYTTGAPAVVALVHLLAGAR